MQTVDDTVRAYLLKLGFDEEVADIYLALHTYGPQGISQLARLSGVERTRVYRLLEAMKTASLIEIEVHYKRSVIKAADINSLEALLAKREQELRGLQDELRSLEKSFTPKSISSPLTRVNFFQGADGTKQMFWNQTRAKGEVLCILYENMQSKTNAAFFERWVRRCNEQNLQFRGIIGEHFIDTQKQWYATRQNERLANWQPRLIDPKLLTVGHSTILYDNVVSYFNWKDGEVFGVELHNREIALAQRQLFAMLWNQATPVDDVTGLPLKNA